MMNRIIEELDAECRYYERMAEIARGHNRMMVDKCAKLGLWSRRCGAFLRLNQAAIDQGSEWAQQPIIHAYLRAVK